MDSELGRRDFLKRLGIGVAAIAALPYLPSAPDMKQLAADGRLTLYGNDFQMSSLFIETQDSGAIEMLKGQLAHSINQSIKLAGKTPIGEMKFTLCAPRGWPVSYEDEDGIEQTHMDDCYYLTAKQYAYS